MGNLISDVDLNIANFAEGHIYFDYLQSIFLTALRMSPSLGSMNDR